MTRPDWWVRMFDLGYEAGQQLARENSEFNRKWLASDFDRMLPESREPYAVGLEVGIRHRCELKQIRDGDGT